MLALVSDAGMRSLTDAKVYAWASARARTVVTENVKDFRPLWSDGGAGLLFTSSRTFPRTRRNPALLVDALVQWLVGARSRVPLVE